MNAKTTQPQSRLVRRVAEYFLRESQNWPVGSIVEVLPSQNGKSPWAGRKPGERGVIVMQEITSIQGRRCHLIVPAVRFQDGDIEWGMNMQEKLISIR